MHCSKVAGKVKHKAVVLSEKSWNDILQEIRPSDTKALEEEEKYAEYLKKESEKLKKQWPEQNKQVDSAVKDNTSRDNLLKEQENRRQKQIKQAIELITRSRHCSRQLESEALLGYVLQCQQIQQTMNKNLAKETAEKQKFESYERKVQIEKELKEEQQKIAERKKKFNDYKLEIYDTIQKRDKNKSEGYRKQQEIEKTEREVFEKSVQEENERENQLRIQKKKEMRKAAKDAMEMVAARKEREQLENDIENKIVEIYYDGKNEIENLLKEKERKRQESLMARCEKNSEHLKKLQNHKSNDVEEQLQQRLYKELETKQNLKEINKLNYERKLRTERINQCNEDKKNAQIKKNIEEEEKRWLMAERIKNDEVNLKYMEKRLEEVFKQKDKTSQLYSTHLQEQIRGKQVRKNEDDRIISPGYEKIDEHFFGYAQTLIEDAEKKSRPTLPIRKAVANYIHENKIKGQQIKCQKFKN